MTFTSWILFFFIIQVIHFLGTWKLYQKAGRKAWEALVPIYNAYILLKIIQRPVWWIVILFIPIVNVIFLPVLWVETIRSFRKYTTLDTILVIVTLGFYIYYVNYFLDVTYNEKRDLSPLNFADDFIGSVTYAVIFATFIHTFFIQPFIIPTSSLEKSLLVGDMLFVSKFHYGARVPRTAVSFPMVHDTIPVIGKKSYLSFPQYPSFRLPGFQEIKHNDIICFNWPADTVYQFWDKQKRHIDKPLDKRSNYVKRCLGLPGDIFQIKNGDVLVNGKKLPLHDRQKLQYSYNLYLKDNIITSIIDDYKIQFSDAPTLLVNLNNKSYYENKEVLNKELNVNLDQFFTVNDTISNKQMYLYRINLTDELYNEMKKDARIYSIQKYINLPSLTTFPHNQPTWSIDNMGPIKIPKEGEVITLTKENLPLYKRLITVYENNT
ncbi:MAG: signal peptidase I [Flavobacterium sp.]